MSEHQSLVERLEEAALQADRDSHEFPPVRSNWSALLQAAADYISSRSDWTVSDMEAAHKIMVVCGIAPLSPSKEPGVDALADRIAVIIAARRENLS